MKIALYGRVSTKDKGQEKVKLLRIALKLTQQEFADRLGLGIATIVRYERCDRVPDARALGRLQQVAEESGFEELAKTFRLALAEQITPPTRVNARELVAPYAELLTERLAFARQGSADAVELSINEAESILALLIGRCPCRRGF